MPNDMCPKCGGTGVKIDNVNLRLRRLNSGKPAKEVAVKMRITQQYLSDLERGRKDWNGDLLARFNKALR